MQLPHAVESVQLYRWVQLSHWTGEINLGTTSCDFISHTWDVSHMMCELAPQKWLLQILEFCPLSASSLNFP